MAKDGKKAAKAKSVEPEKLKNKQYLEELHHLHVELVKLQEWVKAKGVKVCVVFEGRDGAGKGGTIKALTERVSPRVFRVVALPAPTEREKSQMYMQRYLAHMPAAGEVVIFDRSWYNRAGVERVMGFCKKEQVERFLELAPMFERTIVESGVILLKYWLEVSPEEQTRRLEARINDGRKTWKLTPMDLKSYSRWYDYSRARDEMFKYTDTEHAPSERGIQDERDEHVVVELQALALDHLAVDDELIAGPQDDEVVEHDLGHTAVRQAAHEGHPSDVGLVDVGVVPADLARFLLVRIHLETQPDL